MEFANNLIFLFSETPYISYPFIFFVGTVLASFGGVVVYRLPIQYGWVESDKSDYTLSFPPSHCDSCNKNLSLVDLIPILGWFLNKGKCNQCHSSVPFIFPLTEFLMGLAFIKSFLIFGFTIEAVLFCLLLWFSFVIAWIDWNTEWIPEMFTTPLMFTGFLLSPFAVSIQDSVVGSFTAWALFTFTFWIISKIKRVDAYSGGDIAFAYMAGAWVGMHNILEYLFASSVIFIIFALLNKDRKWIPMGPALAIAFILEILLIQFGLNFFPK